MGEAEKQERFGSMVAAALLVVGGALEGVMEQEEWDGVFFSVVAASHPVPSLPLLDVLLLAIIVVPVPLLAVADLAEAEPSCQEEKE